MPHASLRFRTLLATAALLLASAPAWAIKPFSANYQASYMGMQGSGLMKLEAAGQNRWRYTLRVKSSLADLSQSTVFEEHAGRWRPISGSDSSKVLVKKSSKQASYDWASGQASWSGDVKPDRKGPVKLEAGDMDALLINLALVRDVAEGKPLNYRMVEDGRIKQMQYTVAGKEQIEIGGKQQQATKVVNSSGEKQTIAWIVEGMPVPARILQRNHGEDTIDLWIKSN